MKGFIDRICHLLKDSSNGLAIWLKNFFFRFNHYDLIGQVVE